MVDLSDDGEQATIELSDYSGFYTDTVYPIITVRSYLSTEWTFGEGVIVTDRFDVEIGTDVDEGIIQITKGAGRAYFPYLLASGGWRLFLGPQASLFNVVVGSAGLTAEIVDTTQIILTGIPAEWYA